jgi:hypothetical protein
MLETDEFVAMMDRSAARFSRERIVDTLGATTLKGFLPR